MSEIGLSKRLSRLVLYYGFSVIPVVAVCLLVFYLPFSLTKAWPLVLIEWLVVVAAFCFLCPWLRLKGIAYAATVFIAAHVVSLVLVAEYSVTQDAHHAWSDDYYYITRGELVASVIADSSSDAGAIYRASGGRWSLCGYPIVLGYLFSTVEGGLNARHAAALGLNAMCLAMVLAFLYRYLEKQACGRPGIFFLFFLAVLPELLVTAAQSRKDLTLILTLVAALSAAKAFSDRRNLLVWGAVLIGATFYMVFNRVAYVAVFGAAMGWTLFERMPVKRNLRILGLGLLLALAWVGLKTSDLGIRGKALNEWMSLSKAEAYETSGYAGRAYRIPVVGPFIYYAIVPVPQIPFIQKHLDEPDFLKTLVRGTGTLLYLGLLAMVAWRTLQGGWPRGEALLIALVFVMLFGAAVLTGWEPRHKVPSNPFLAMLAFLSVVEPSTRAKRQGSAI